MHTVLINDNLKFIQFYKNIMVFVHIVQATYSVGVCFCILIVCKTSSYIITEMQCCMFIFHCSDNVSEWKKCLSLSATQLKIKCNFI